MFREFNVKFEDVEMLGGADNLLEGTEITKVIVRGDNNKMSSLDSMLKNCNELDTIDGELDLNCVSDIDNLLEGTELVKSINLKNINNENISANNSFPHVDQINIGGELYNKRAMQNVIASKDWTFDNIKYSGTVGDNIVTKEVNIIDDNKATIKDTLEQKAKGIEIIGQTYENLVVGNGEVALLDELTLESIDGSTKEFNPHLEQSVCVEAIEGETYQNLIEGKGEYKLTDTFSTTWTESNNSIENPPSMIEIPEIFGNTVQGYANQVTTKQLYDSINSVSWTDGYGCTTDENYNYIKLKVWGTQDDILSSLNDNSFIQLKANTTYSMQQYNYDTKLSFRVYTPSVYSPTSIIVKSSYTESTTLFTTDSTGKVFIYLNNCQSYNAVLRVVEGEVDLSQYAYDEYDLNYIQSVGDLYVDESGEPILDEEGNEQYKLEIESKNVIFHDEYKNLPVGKFYLKKGDYTFSWNISFGLVLARTRIYNLQGQFIDSLFESDNRRGSGRVTLEGTKNMTINEDGWYMETLGADDAIGYITQREGYNADTSIIPQSNKTTILMPQPLRKVGDFCDKLYYDYERNKYTLEVNIDPYSEVSTSSFSIQTQTDNYITMYQHINSYPKIKSTTVLCNTLPSIKNFNATEVGVYGANAVIYFTLRKSELTSYDVLGFKEWFTNNPSYLVGVLRNPLLIETKILEKPSLEAYSPKTYISTSTEIQPSQMTVTNKKVDYIPLSLQPNKDYTLQLDSIGKNDKPITVNLGGTETTIQPINDTSKHHKVVVRTPNTLTTDKLDLSGEGVIVNDVMLFEGGSNEIKQEVEYVEGIENIGKYTITKNKFPNNIVFTKDRTLLNDGTIYGGTTTDYATEDYILCNLDVNKVYSISSPFTYKKVAFYDESKKFISIINTNTNTYLNGFSIPSNAKYYRVSVNNSAGKEIKIQIEEGNTHTSYEEYFEGEKYKIDILSTNGVKNLVNTNPNNWVVKDSDSVIIKSSIKVNKGKTYTVFNSMGQWVAVYESDLNGNQYNLIRQDNTGNWSFIATSEYIKVSLWNISYVSDKLSQPHNMNVRIFEGCDDYGYNGYEERKLSIQSMLLPQPLRKIGEIKDKFYWDENKGHYCIEQNISCKTFTELTFSGGSVSDNVFSGWGGFNIDGGNDWRIKPIIRHNNKHIKEITLYNRGSYTEINISIKDCTSIDDANIKLNEDLPLTVLFARTTPNTIDLPHLNKKYSLDTYMPTTYVECTNNPMQPSRILLESDTVRYKPSVLETDTDYTIQFECKEKSDKKVKLNLGGSEKEVDIEVGLNHVSITTPSELANDRLFLSGAGNKVSDVIVNKGEMNQYLEYFDGVQSTGELQDDGTYKIEVSTENEFKNTNLWDGKKVSDYVTDFIEIYDNTFSLNSYDAYITEYDADRQLVTREYMTSTANKMLTAKNSNCKYITVRSNIFKETDPYYVKEGLLVLSNRMVSLKEKPTGFRNSLKVLISSNSPLAKGDKLYWNKSNKRYEIDRSGSVEVPAVEGDVIDLPRLYQRENTYFSTSTGNIKPSKIKLDYNDLD